MKQPKDYAEPVGEKKQTRKEMVCDAFSITAIAFLFAFILWYQI